MNRVGPLGGRHTSAAIQYLWSIYRKRLPLPRKPKVKVFIHNGTTVYESANNIAEWEVKYAQYIDSINTDIKGQKS